MTKRLGVLAALGLVGACTVSEPPAIGAREQALVPPAHCNPFSPGWPCDDADPCTIDQCVIGGSNPMYAGTCVRTQDLTCTSSQDWFVAPDGSASGDGSQSAPWSLAHAGTCAGGLIGPGDTVYLDGGTYWDEYVIDCNGTAADPIKFVSASRHRAVIDSAYQPFTVPNNVAWVPYLVNGTQNVYRSVATFPTLRTSSFTGFIMLPAGPMTLITHGDENTGLNHLLSAQHAWAASGDRYIGPGVVYNSADERIYIRLDNSTPAAQRNRAVWQISNPDPRRWDIRLASNATSALAVEGDHLVFDGLTVSTARQAINLHPSSTGADDVTFRNMRIRGGYFGARLGAATNVQFLDSTFDGHMPGPYFSASEADIKGPGEIATQTRKVALDLGVASNVTIEGCEFNDLHDAILSSVGAHHISVKNNLFRGSWDDSWQLVYGVHHVEIAYNKFYGAGISRDHTGASTSMAPNQGTVFLHHNVFDPHKNQIWWYRGGQPAAPNTDPDGMIDGIPLSTHGNYSDTQYGFPWKLYYNTFIVAEPKDDNVSIGAIGEYGNIAEASSGPDPLVPTLYDGAPHEVYNNIFVDQAGFTPGPTYRITGRLVSGVIQGREMYDGNAYSGWPKILPRPIYRYVRYSNGQIYGGPSQQGIYTPEELRTYATIMAETTSYPIPSFSSSYNGWEASGFATSTLVTFDSCYRPTNCPDCLAGAVSLVGSGWPGTATYEAARGAVQPTGCL